VLIAAVLSGDENMIDAYKTDVYISFAKAANLYLADVQPLEVLEIKKLGHTRQDVGDIRQGTKPVVLGMQYGSGVASLQQLTGLPLQEVERLVATYKNHYSRYYKWREELWATHCNPSAPPLTLPNGWYIGKSHDNKLSLQNQPVQGTGVVILHRALDLVLSAGVHVCNSLHDAIYGLVEDNEAGREQLKLVEKLMNQAAAEVLGTDLMRCEMETWAHGERVITGKGRADYEQFKEFVEKD